jgi:hypothetical protein
VALSAKVDGVVDRAVTDEDQQPGPPATGADEYISGTKAHAA